MKFCNFIIATGVIFILSSCHSIKDENYPTLTQLQKKYLVTVKFDGKITRVPIYFKESTIKLTGEAFFPDKWILPNIKKSEPAIPKFKNPTSTGLTLTVYLQYNQTDNKVILAGKYKYTYYSIASKQNLFLSGTDNESYTKIITPEIITRESSFYMIPIKLNRQYKVVIENTHQPVKELTISVSYRDKPIKIHF